MAGTSAEDAPSLFEGQSVASMLRFRAAATPDHSFLVFDDVELSYRAVLEAAEDGAAALGASGVARGDRVALFLDNCLEFFVCWFGAALLGAVVVPANPESSPDECRYILTHAGSAVAVCRPEQAKALRELLPESRGVISTGAEFDDLRRRTRRPERAESAGLDPLAILYTSGTTSRPKGVVVTHANYLHAGSVVAEQLRMRPDDRWLVVLPLFHANAQYYCVMSALVTGASVAVMPRFSASGWAAAARRHRATLASLFAAPVRMILAKDWVTHDAENVLRATIFSQNLREREVAEFERRFECPLIQVYGMTETIAPPLMNSLYGPRDSMTIGRPTSSAHVRVVDPGGRDVPLGGVGELWVGGRPGVSLMAEYHADAASTAAATMDGWLRTGDLVRRAFDGNLVFHDRAKDMIKRSGENVAASEVERVVNEHPAVLESAVVGIPDPIRDEAIRVFVVPKVGMTVTAEEVIEFCAGMMARYKVPSEVILLEELPRTSVGKVNKHLLRQGPAAEPGEQLG